MPSLSTRVLRVRAVALGTFGLGLVLGISFLGPLVLRASPTAMDIAGALVPPSAGHLLGTDDFGRDVLIRVMYGGRISLGAGLAAVLLATALGTPLGLLFGFFGGITDGIGMRFLDLLMAFPSLLLALAVVAALGTGVRNTVVAVGITFAPLIARMVRASVLTVAKQEYVAAARVVGSGDLRIIRRHVLPNALPTVLVTGTLVFGFAVLTVSALSFIGLAVRPPAPELGAMLSEARSSLQTAWWMTVGPGTALIVLILSINALGDGFRYIFDPRLRL